MKNIILQNKLCLKEEKLTSGNFDLSVQCRIEPFPNTNNVNDPNQEKFVTTNGKNEVIDIPKDTYGNPSKYG